MEKFITLSPTNIDDEHICCAISDKKCQESYQKKKAWLKQEFANDYVFRRIDARAKVFMETVRAEKAWLPVDAPNYVMINCFWVSGKYKKNGYGKELLRLAIEEAKEQGKSGLVTVVGTKKYHFMSDTKWFIRQGFKTVETTENGFGLLVLQFHENAPTPSFRPSVYQPVKHSEDLVVYYSNRCPFAECHVQLSLDETAKKRSLTYKAIKFETLEQAQNSPTPATIFSLFYKGKFATTDISVCMDSRFDKIISKKN